MARYLQISLEEIESSFDNCRRKTASKALLDYRLNRLCDQMCENPSEEIRKQIKRCGLKDFEITDIEFENNYGIDIVEYHKQCFLAAASRCQKGTVKTVNDEELICDSTSRILRDSIIYRHI